ncbi:MAG: Smr/MutS family protein [Parvularculaceae bacterium]
MRRRKVTADEAELWRRAVRDVRPAGRFTLRNDVAEQRVSGPAVERMVREAPAIAAKRAAAHFIYGGGDPGRDRAAGGRRLPIERTLDLHGMTQVEAHVELLRFVSGAVANGLRLVLVVTGKGKSSGRPGVLRERFLDWIETAPLRGEIARVAPARPKDGGAGAFYVYLKSKGAGATPRL